MPYFFRGVGYELVIWRMASVGGIWNTWSRTMTLSLRGSATRCCLWWCSVWHSWEAYWLCSAGMGVSMHWAHNTIPLELVSQDSQVACTRSLSCFTFDLCREERQDIHPENQEHVRAVRQQLQSEQVRKSQVLNATNISWLYRTGQTGPTDRITNNNNDLITFVSTFFTSLKWSK